MDKYGGFGWVELRHWGRCGGWDKSSIANRAHHLYHFRLTFYWSCYAWSNFDLIEVYEGGFCEWDCCLVDSKRKWALDALTVTQKGTSPSITHLSISTIPAMIPVNLRWSKVMREARIGVATVWLTASAGVASQTCEFVMTCFQNKAMIASMVMAAPLVKVQSMMSGREGGRMWLVLAVRQSKERLDCNAWTVFGWPDAYWWWLHWVWVETSGSSDYASAANDRRGC